MLMSACSFHKLAITNPVPQLAPERSMAGLASTTVACPITQQYSATDPASPVGYIPYTGQPTPERQLFTSYWQDLIRRYGMRIKWWRHGFDFREADTLYGEQPGAKYADSELLIGVAEMTNNSTTLQRFGFQATSDVKLLIAIEEFARVFGTTIRPKSDDLFTFVDVYNDRPSQFGPRIFQVTFIDDEGPDTNFLGGHYVWTIEAVRFAPSYERNIPSETQQPLTLQGSEDDVIGILPNGLQPTSPPKPYSDTVDEQAEQDFDISARNEGSDKVYGGY